MPASGRWIWYRMEPCRQVRESLDNVRRVEAETGRVRRGVAGTSGQGYWDGWVRRRGRTGSGDQEQAEPRGRVGVSGGGTGALNGVEAYLCKGAGGRGDVVSGMPLCAWETLEGHRQGSRFLSLWAPGVGTEGGCQVLPGRGSWPASQVGSGERFSGLKATCVADGRWSPR